MITSPEALFLQIAQRNLPDLETLETRRSDSLDFHDAAVWSIRAMIAEAYEAGIEAGTKASAKAA